MRTIQEFPAWFSKQKLGGKLFIGCSTLFIFCCLCSFSIAALSPESPTSKTVVSTDVNVSSLQTAAVKTVFAGITQTAIANAPTLTFTPPMKSIITATYIAEPTFTAILLTEPTYTATYIATSTPEQSALLSSLGVSCVPRTTKLEEGLVVGIVDGDTINVIISGKNFSVRYIGINTPEKNENLYWQATGINQELVFNKKVLLVNDVSETDKYGRLLRYVFADGTFINYELVKQGYAVASTYPPDVACSEYFANAQTQARSVQVGLWASTPTPPASVGGGSGGNGGNGSGSGSGSNCDPSYPTVCIPPPPPDLDCKDIPYRKFQVLPPDPHRFDGDNDGIGCES